jgi:hypothetical protein
MQSRKRHKGTNGHPGARAQDDCGTSRDTGSQTQADDENLRVITGESLAVCKHSAGFWASKLGPYAQQMRARADGYKIAAAVFTTVASLAVWTTLASSTRLWAVIVVSIAAVATGVVAIVPQQKGYGACADSAAGLADSYGQVYGELGSALEMIEKKNPNAQAYAAVALAHFTTIRSQKQKLWPQPVELQKEVEAARKKLGLDEDSLSRYHATFWKKHHDGF